MALYEYFCRECGTKYEAFVPMAERNKEVPCPMCRYRNKKKITFPMLKVSQEDDSYWENAEKNRINSQALQHKERQEKIRYEDKRTMESLNNEVNNYERLVKKGIK